MRFDTLNVPRMQDMDCGLADFEIFATGWVGSEREEVVGEESSGLSRFPVGREGEGGVQGLLGFQSINRFGALGSPIFKTFLRLCLKLMCIENTMLVSFDIKFITRDHKQRMNDEACP